MVVRGQSLRLGQVETGGTESFDLPTTARAVGEIELLADPIGTDAEYTTGHILVVPGTVIELRIENNLRLSSYSVSGT